MFEALQERLGAAFRQLAGRGVVRAEDVDAALREVRVALLEADVHVQVVREFLARVREAALGQEVWKSLSPAQQVVQVVHAELTRLLGGTRRELVPAPKPPTVVLLCGLHGSGKTTQAGKLAVYLRKHGRRPLLVAADLQRPAAVRQLQVVGERAGVPVFSQHSTDPVEVARAGVTFGRASGCDFVLLDTAGRVHVDPDLLAELRRVREATEPHHVLLVLDAMTGQEAVRVAQEFHTALGLDGVVLTKLDGDARGGAALSLAAVVGCPILFVGTGEKLDALEPFHPDRMASRILGMGDVLTLVERAQEAADAQKAADLERRLRRAQFTLEDFREQLQQLHRMGPLDNLLDMIPGMAALRGRRPEAEERELRKMEAILNSMTPQERQNPALLDASRKRRIARGSGTTVQDVNRLLRQFEQTKQMMRELERMGRRGKRLPFPPA